MDSALIYALFLIILNCASATPPNICSYCQCDGDKTVKCEKVSDQVLFDPNNWILDNATVIETIVVHNSDLQALHSKFPKIDQLQHLDLSHNNIVTIGDSVFENLQDLYSLELHHNDLTTIQPDAFKGFYQQGSFMPLKSLRRLTLNNNELTNLNADVFEHIEDLELLDLSYNALGNIDTQTQVALSSLQKLKSLDLSGCKLQDLPERFLYTHQNLETINLSNNPMDKLPKTLKFASGLVNLYMNGTYLTVLDDLNMFPNLPNLTVLHISHCDALKSIQNGTLAGLTQLEELYLCDNPLLSEIDPMALGKREDTTGPVIYPPVRKLHIQNNNLTQLDSNLLANWQRLVDLDIRGNKWMCECQSSWHVTILTPLYARIAGEAAAAQLQCSFPVQMAGRSMWDLYKKQYHLRCLDVNGAHPERDGALLVGVLAGILIALPCCAFVYFAYKRSWFGLFDSSPAAYSRQFYGRSASVYEEDF